MTSIPVQARVFMTVDEALERAFPGCEVERTTAYLTDAQRERASELAGTEVESALVHPYRIRCGGEAAGTAYFDSHRVRTLPETLMVVVSPEGEISRVEVLAFREPEDYLPRPPWYRQLLGRRLEPGLRLKRGVDAVTGATLTARATVGAVRRALALDRVLSADPVLAEGRAP